MGAGKLMLGWDRTLVQPGDRVCVAISGGADSTALLLSIAEANAVVDPGAVEANKPPLGLLLSAACGYRSTPDSQARGDGRGRT